MKKLLLSTWFTALFVSVCIVSFNVQAQVETQYNAESMANNVLAFPGAEGFGRFTTGGRGGEVYEVTNLQDSGVGSLRYAVEQSGARTVVFRVSGTIELQKDLKINRDNISIFGQTAPGGGIATSGYSVVIDANNVIIQYMRFRPGDIYGNQSDAIWGRDNSDIIIDHGSMSWSIDEAASFYDNVNFTLQWSMLYESLYQSKHDKGEHGYGGIWGGQGATFHHNLLAHHSNRNPRFHGSRYSGRPDLEYVDYRNNVIYNWGENSAYGGEKGHQNVIANYYKPGPATPDGEKAYRILDAKPPSGDYKDLGWWYVADNYIAGNAEVTANNIDKGIQRVLQVHKDTILVDEPFPAPALPSFESAEEAYLNVLANAGAILPARDTLDRRIIREVADGTATYGGIWGSGSGIIDSQEDVGGWPELAEGEAPVDTDKDGMPDSWEVEHNLDPNDYSDGKIITESGYSNVELYIHSLSEGAVSDPFPGESGLIYPVNEIGVDGYPEFRWEEALYATGYQLELREGNQTLVDTLIADTTFTFAENTSVLKSSTSYSWRVRASNESGLGGWSQFRYFNTGTITSNEISGDLPDKVALMQNYPNPFNPTTEIQFQLPQTSQVQLQVFDVTGKMVRSLLSEMKSPGHHSVNFDASNLGSGIYLYELIVRASDGIDQRLTRRMTLIK